jgi:hypothetical protein
VIRIWRISASLAAGLMVSFVGQQWWEAVFAVIV